MQLERRLETTDLDLPLLFSLIFPDLDPGVSRTHATNSSTEWYQRFNRSNSNVMVTHYEYVPKKENSAWAGYVYSYVKHVLYA